MKTKRSWMLTLAALFLTMAMAMPGWAAEQKSENAQPAMTATPPQAASVPVTIMGTIIANKNDKGKITSYALQEDSGQALVISQHGSGMQLRRMVGNKIEATGTVYENKGEKTIIVNEFKKIE